MSMNGISRRTVLKSTLGAAAVASYSTTSQAASRSANEEVRVGLIGLGGQGRAHLRNYPRLKNSRLVYICDTDRQRLSNAAKTDRSLRAVSDLRRVLDDKAIDAVSIATPDHWHTPAALLAMDAGKHVYVEKPCSHNVREGRWLVDAAKRHRRLVQHGTQTRSSEFFQNVVQRLREGIIGNVLIARAWNVQRRANIGHKMPSSPPPHVDYETWLGPAPFMPFQSNRFHYNWHWWHHFGTGDAGNDGVHELDFARWGLGVDSHPSRISSCGGKYFHDDDQQFPDTMTATFDYPGDGKLGHRKQLIFEMRLWCTNYPENVDSGVEFLGTKGRLFASKRGKFQLLGERNRRAKERPAGRIEASVARHQQNFIDAIRGSARLNSDALTGHLSASLPHLANLATRLGRTIQFDARRETAVNDAGATELLGRVYRKHWATPKLA